MSPRLVRIVARACAFVCTFFPLHVCAASVEQLYVFPVDDPTRVALVLTIGRSGAGPYFDPNVVYTLHIDNVGDDQEHLTFQIRADPNSPRGPQQRLLVAGPAVPGAADTATTLVPVMLGSAPYNAVTVLDKGVNFYAGLRRDPFFFDAQQFARVRAGRAACFLTPPLARNAYVASDVLAFVLEAPKTLVAPRNRGRIAVWATAAERRSSGEAFVLTGRLGRPGVRELFGGDVANVAAVAQAPKPGGAARSPQTAAALATLLRPDVLRADIEAPGRAAYLDLEAPSPPTPSPSPIPTAAPSLSPGASPAPSPRPTPRPVPTPYRPFGGRGLADPALGLDLDALYGDLLARSRRAADDGRETPCLTSDHLVAPRNLGANAFPYLDAPFAPTPP